MRAFVLIAIPVVAATLLGVSLRRGDAMLPPAAVERPRPTLAVLAPTPLEVDRAIVDENAPASLTCRVLGRILDGGEVDGPCVGLPGATITLPGTTRRTQSGPDGRFEFAEVTANPSATLVVAHEGRATLVRRATLWPEALVDVGDLVLHADASVVGRVIDDQDRPVPHAKVTASPAETRADGDGAFALRGLAAGAHALHAEAPGHARGRAVMVRLNAGATERDVELRVDRARELSGRVETDYGGPIAGALIEARVDEVALADATPLRVESDAYGAFTLGPLPRGRAQVIVTHRDHLPFGRLYPTDTRGAVITLTPTRAISGRVVEAETGAEVSITRVQLLVSSETDDGPWRCLGAPFEQAGDEAARGRFRLPLGIHTTARLVVLSDEHAPALSAPFWMGRENVGPLLLAATKGARLQGVVCDERGRPVPGAEVTVLAPIGDGELVQTGASVALAAAQSDASGAFASAPLTPGRYRLRVRRAGYRHVDTDCAVGSEPAAPLRLIMARAGTIRGCVGNLPEGRQRVRVEAAHLDAGSPPRVNRAIRQPTARVEDGEFILDALAPGHYRVRLLGLAGGHEFATLASDVAVEVGRETYVAFTVRAGD